MGGFLKCPKCNDYMFMRIEYNAAIPYVWHKCESCGYDTKDAWKETKTSNRTDYVGGTMNGTSIV